MLICQIFNIKLTKNLTKVCSMKTAAQIGRTQNQILREIESQKKNKSQMMITSSRLNLVRENSQRRSSLNLRLVNLILQIRETYLHINRSNRANKESTMKFPLLKIILMMLEWQIRNKPFNHSSSGN
jgi:hypothetical protein